MVELDAATLTTRELNRRIKELAAAGQDAVVANPGARHNIAVGVLQPCRIRVEGSVGYYSASMLDGPEVEIEGNDVAEFLERMYVNRWRSLQPGRSRYGLMLREDGHVLDDGFLTGFMMQKGRIIVCGDAGDAVGDSMYEGTIYVAGSYGSLGSDATVEEASEEELLDLWGTLESHGIGERPHFTKIVSAKRLYHLDSLERLEKAAV